MTQEAEVDIYKGPCSFYWYKGELVGITFKHESKVLSFIVLGAPYTDTDEFVRNLEEFINVVVEQSESPES